jgi:hypothetical protein
MAAEFDRRHGGEHSVWLMTNRPCSSTKRSLLTRSKSEQFLTGKKRDLGTLMQRALWKCLMAEPAAVCS